MLTEFWGETIPLKPSIAASQSAFLRLCFLLYSGKGTVQAGWNLLRENRLSGVVSEDKRKCVPPLGSLPVTHFPEVSFLLLGVLSVLQGCCVGASRTFCGYNSRAGRLVSNWGSTFEQWMEEADRRWCSKKKKKQTEVKSELVLRQTYFNNVMYFRVKLYIVRKNSAEVYWIVNMGIAYSKGLRPVYFRLV